jgi:hypothetical protein
MMEIVGGGREGGREGDVVGGREREGEGREKPSKLRGDYASMIRKQHYAREPTEIK